MVEDLDEGGILEEVHMADFHVLHLHAQALLKVGQKLFPLFGDNVLNLVVQHQLGGGVPHQALAFQDGHQHHDKRIHQCHHPHVPPAQGVMRGIGLQAHHVIDRGQAVDGRQGNDDEQVGHFPDGHRLRAVADNPEDGEQAQGKAHAHLHIAHDIEQREHGR